MKNILLATLLLSALTIEADDTRGIGLYPGASSEYYAPIVSWTDGGGTLANVALHRAAYASSAIDYNHTAHLVTDGIYAWMRNPLYTGWMFIIIGVALCFGNLWLLVLPFIFWALMAIMLKPTEEKWLRNLYGTEYDAYCKRVNRTWPWFPKQY